MYGRVCLCVLGKSFARHGMCVCVLLVSVCVSPLLVDEPRSYRFSPSLLSLSLCVSLFRFEDRRSIRRRTGCRRCLLAPSACSKRGMRRVRMYVRAANLYSCLLLCISLLSLLRPFSLLSLALPPSGVLAVFSLSLSFSRYNCLSLTHSFSVSSLSYGSPFLCCNISLFSLSLALSLSLCLSVSLSLSLPSSVVCLIQALQRRVRRAMDLNVKRKFLPYADQLKQKPYESYTLQLIRQASQERLEKENYK